MADNITLRSLIFYGTHGHTAKEKLAPQRFIVDILIESDFLRAASTDNLNHAVDYRSAREAARQVIENGNYELIETIAGKIASEIIKDTKVKKVEVSVTKPDIWQKGEPTVTISRRQTPRNLDLLNFDWLDLVAELSGRGAVSLPILPIERRLALVAEAENYPFIQQPEMAESPLVREQLSSFLDFPKESLFFKLKDDFSELIARNFLPEEFKMAFPKPLEFNEMSLQLYKKGSIGITPHRDGKSRINLICVFILKGKARYALCDDRAGSNPIYLDTTPGNVIILRGPGFLNSKYQPFHFLADVTEDRIVFGLRQRLFKK